jgi:hypothetical protein
MKKAEKKPITKEASSVKSQEMKTVEVPALEEKPKMMFEPVVEEIVPVVPIAVQAEVKTEEVVSPAGETTPVVVEEAAKPEVPAGELARSIDTLAKIVDDSKTGTDQKVQITDKTIRQNGSGGTLGMILAFIIGLCLGIVVGYVLWGRFVIGGVEVVSDKEPVTVGEQIATITPTVSPTPKAEVLKRTDLKIKVLNGTGGKGVAAAGKTYLESLGYANVEAGNAKRNDYAKTEVILSKDKAAYWEMLKKDLAAKYTLVDGFTTDEDLLAASGGVDALVIVGSE